MPKYCPSCGQWPTHKSDCSNNPRPQFVGESHRLIMQLKGRINELNEVLNQRNAECRIFSIALKRIRDYPDIGKVSSTVAAEALNKKV